MAERRKAQGKVGTWPGPAGIAAPWLWPLPGLAGPMAARLREWAAAEVAPGRLMPWLPVGFGLGIVVYFSADREPVWWVAAILATVAVAAAYRLRARSIGFPVAIGCAAVAAGFATATLKSRLFDHTILLTSAYSVSITGFVETREERERSDRIVVRVTTMDGERSDGDLERVRLSVKRGLAP